MEGASADTFSIVACIYLKKMRRWVKFSQREVTLGRIWYLRFIGLLVLVAIKEALETELQGLMAFH